jgi:hypothetical protein
MAAINFKNVNERTRRLIMKFIQLLLPAAMMLLSSGALAGEYKADPVLIDDATHTAGGNLYEARFRIEGGNELIGCALGSGTRGTYGYCSAHDGSQTVGCLTYDQKILNVIASINTFSFIFFEWGDRYEATIGEITHYDCLHVTVATRSTHIPDIFAPVP